MDNLSAFLKTLSSRPGVYRLLDADRVILYVGKAKNIKKRVRSYFRASHPDPKTRAMMVQVVDVDITLVNTENDALLLEANLIKKYRPRYNVLLRDDKSYPFLFLSTSSEFPRLDFHRGAKRRKGHYFGPYPNAGAVRKNLALIQKLFQVRQCSDSFFSNRSRPCLQYQINRCTAPCVGYVTKEDYAQQVDLTVLFLEGKNQQVIEHVTAQMVSASDQQQYELAGQCRDLIMRLRELQRQQSVTTDEGDVDVIAVVQANGDVGVAVLLIRGGQMMGHKTFFPTMPMELSDTEVMSAFLPQYYLSDMRMGMCLDRIIANVKVKDKAWTAASISSHLGRRVRLVDTKQAAYQEWLSAATTNAQHDLSQHVRDKNQGVCRLSLLQKTLGLPNAIERVECFDISHTQGEATVASCVVYGVAGAITKDYRRFNIEGITPGDDYAAMKQVLERRYTRLKKEGRSLPDVVLIDGGLGQLKQAVHVFEALQLSGVELVGVAKGRSRKPGEETLWRHGVAQPLSLSSDSPALHLIQCIRDEAHRFAITGHRQRRAKSARGSVLDGIPGVGAKRRRALLHHFGGLQGVKKASVQELAQVSGIHITLAETIYAALHG